MTDTRHVDDTLFFIMEEDWRLTRHDGFSRAELLEQQRVRGEKIVSLSPDQPPPEAVRRGAAAHIAALRDDWQRITSTRVQAPLPGHKGKGKGKEKEGKVREVQGWARASTKPSREEFENTSPFLKQLVRLVTAAHRAWRGDLVWLSWNGSDSKPKANARPQFGSTLLAVSFNGAKRLKEEFWQEHMTRSHFDLSLKWVCENFAQRLMASFVMPTVGHFSTHDSDILQHTRDSEWDKWYVGEGKGKVELMTWEKEGTRVVTKHLLDVDLQQEQPHHDWLTYFNESANPLVELVATSGQQYAHTPSRHGANPQRTQV